MEKYFTYLKSELDKANFKGLGLNSIVAQVTLLNTIVTAPTVQEMCVNYKSALSSPLRSSCKNYIKQYLNSDIPDSLPTKILLSPIFLSLLNNTSSIIQQSVETYIKAFDIEKAFNYLTFLPIERELDKKCEGIDVQILNSYYYMALLLSCNDITKPEMLTELNLALKDANSAALTLCRNINNASLSSPTAVKNHIFRFKGKLDEQIKSRQLETYFDDKLYRMSIDLGDDVMLHAIAYPHYPIFKNEEDSVYYVGRTIGTVGIIEEIKESNTIQFTILSVGVEDDKFPDQDIHETGLQMWQYSRKAIIYNNNKIKKSASTY